MNPLQPKKTPRFKGVRLPPEYENVIKDEVAQDLQDPEDEGQPQPQNRIKKYGGLPFNG